MTTPKTLGYISHATPVYCCSSLTQNPNMLLRTALFPPHLYRGAHYDHVFHPHWLAPGSSFLHSTRGRAPCPFILELPTLLLRYTQNLRVSLSRAFPVQNGISFHTDKAQLRCFFLGLGPHRQIRFSIFSSTKNWQKLKYSLSLKALKADPVWDRNQSHMYWIPLPFPPAPPRTWSLYSIWGISCSCTPAADLEED